MKESIHIATDLGNAYDATLTAYATVMPATPRGARPRSPLRRPTLSAPRLPATKVPSMLAAPARKSRPSRFCPQRRRLDSSAACIDAADAARHNPAAFLRSLATVGRRCELSGDDARHGFSYSYARSPGRREWCVSCCNCSVPLAAALSLRGVSRWRLRSRERADARTRGSTARRRGDVRRRRRCGDCVGRRLDRRGFIPTAP